MSFIDRPVAFNDLSDPYYPVGNSLSTDIIQGCRVGKQCDLLLLGCGDIRNILHTMHVFRQENGSRLKGRTFNVHLNDIEEGVLGRDLILLYLIRNIDPQNPEDMKFLWAVWYDIIISDKHFKRLKQLMQDLTQTDVESSGLYFGNELTKRKLRQTLVSWEEMNVSAQDSIDKRTSYLNDHYHGEFPDTPIKRVSSKVMKQYCDLINSPILSERYENEIRDYILLGVTQLNLGSLPSDDVRTRFQGNRTFFRPGSDKWQVEDNSSPYMCYDLGLEIERYNGQSNSISSLSLEILQKWVVSFQEAVKMGCVVKMFLWLGEATAVCEKDLPAHLRFDFIDTSNISDRIGLLPVLINSQKRLKCDGVLRTEVFHWHIAARTVEEFLGLCLNIPLLLYPTVLGLHLAEELSLGHEQVLEDGSFVGIAKLTLRWRAAHEHEKLTLTNNDAISKALAELNQPKRHIDPVCYIDALQCCQTTREMLKTRLLSLLRDSSATETSGSKKTSPIIHEFEDHYEVSIVTDPKRLKEGTISLNLDDEDPNVVVIENTKDSETLYKITIRLSCGIKISSSKVKVSRKRGSLEVSLFKDPNTTIGERMLPWKLLKTQDISTLPDYPQTDFGTKQLKINISCMYPKGDIKNQAEGPPGHQLELLMVYFLKTAPMSFGTPSLVSTGIASRTHPGEKDNSLFLLEGLKIFENLPTIFLTWYNFDLAQRLVQQGKANPKELTLLSLGGIHNEIVQEHAIHLAEGYELLKKIMNVNSCRMKQELPKDRRWKIKTFLRARYSYSDFLSRCLDLKFGPEAEAKPCNVMKQGINMGDMIGELGLDEKLERETQNSSPQPRTSNANISAISCAICGGTSDCKRCTGCLRIYYCSRECQRKHWPQHKSQCKKT